MLNHASLYIPAMRLFGHLTFNVCHELLLKLYSPLSNSIYLPNFLIPLKTLK